MRIRRVLHSHRAALRVRPMAMLAAAGMLALICGQALAADRWEEAGGGAVAILPVPAKAKIITGGSLACAEQKWTFRLRADVTGAPMVGSDAVVNVDGDSFKSRAEQTASVMSIAVPYEAVDDLKTGTRLSFVVGEGATAASATFSLRSSKQVLEAIAPRCSQIDMTGYDRVSLVEFGPAVEQARPLMAEETELFRAATKSEPTLAATTVQLAGSRSMLFARLCGSTWYYGRSGCTLSAYTRAAETDAWQEAYNSEGVAIYIDQKAGNGGWPNLVTLPMVGSAEPSHWTWNDAVYDMTDRVAADSDAEVEDQGDAQ